MCQNLGACEVVDAHHFDVGTLAADAEDVTADTTETVDAYFNLFHVIYLLIFAIQQFDDSNRKDNNNFWFSNI